MGNMHKEWDGYGEHRRAALLGVRVRNHGGKKGMTETVFGSFSGAFGCIVRALGAFSQHMYTNQQNTHFHTSIEINFPSHDGPVDRINLS